MADDSLPTRAYRAARGRTELRARLTQSETALQAISEEQEHLSKQLEQLLEEDADQEKLANLYKRMKELHERTEELKTHVQETDDIIEEHAAVMAEADIEGAKLRSEALKHQATVAGAAIVGIAAVTRDILPLPDNPPELLVGLLWLTYLTLLLTVCGSLLLMHVEASRVEHVLREGKDRKDDRVTDLAYKFSLLGLPVAVALFTAVQTISSFLQ